MRGVVPEPRGLPSVGVVVDRVIGALVTIILLGVDAERLTEQRITYR